MPLDIRNTHTYTRLTETREICKASDLPIPINFSNYKTLIEGEDLDMLAQRLLGDQHRWRDIADTNLKTILEWGLDFPFIKEIGFP